MLLPHTGPEATVAVLTDLVRAGPAQPVDLAAQVQNKTREKHDELLPDTLLDAGFAARDLDVDGAWEMFSELLASTSYAPAATSQRPAALASDLPATTTTSGPLRGETGFAVIDVETTGFSPRLGDRMVEVAIVLTDPAGAIEQTWTTLLNPGRGPGPTHIHGITAADVADAPRFVDVAGDIAQMFDGRVVVAHNARFDMDFLRNEFTRLGADAPAWATLCTLAFAAELGGEGSLADSLAAEGLANDDPHAALSDSDSTNASLRAVSRAVPARTIGAEGWTCLSTSNIRTCAITSVLATRRAPSTAEPENNSDTASKRH